MARFQIYSGLYEQCQDRAVIATLPPLQSSLTEALTLTFKGLDFIESLDQGWSEVHFGKRHDIVKKVLETADVRLYDIRAFICEKLAEAGHEIVPPYEVAPLPGNGRREEAVVDQCNAYFNSSYGFTSQPADAMAY